MIYTGKFSPGQWVYVVGDLSQSRLLNNRRDRSTLLSKEGKRLKIQISGVRSFLFQANANGPVACYQASNLFFAEEDLMSCEEYTSFKKFDKIADGLL